jgi:multisubunit Na+/H+ antiporter MnhG subunit
MCGELTELEVAVRIWKFLHILSMFSGVTLLVGGSLFFEAVARTRDAGSIARFGKAMKRFETLGVVFVILGVGFGLAFATAEDVDLLAGWLIAAYVLVGLLFIIGPIESAMVAKVVEAAESGDQAALDIQIRRETRAMLNILSVMIYGAIIYDMVMKPF